MRSFHPFQIAVAFLLSLSFAGGAVAQDDLADVIDRCERSVIRIEVQTAQGGSLGSGFVVESDGLFVTNVHVLAGATKAVAYFRDGKAYEIKGTYVVDQARDICIAKFEAKDLPVISLAENLPRKGQQVVALGSPQGLSFSATRGIVSAIRTQEEARRQLGDKNREGTWVQVDAALSGGNSGGPLINTSGDVVAMSTLASQGAAQNLNFGISISDIKAKIDLAKRSKLVSLPDSVGKIDVEEASPKSGALIARGDIPASALEKYMSKGREDYTDLFRAMRKETSSAISLLKTMKKGETYIPGGGRNYEVIVEKRRGTDKYYFRNESVKRREISRQEELVDRLQEAKEKIKQKPDDESLFTLLMVAGPRLDTRRKSEIGFMRDGVVLHAYNDHDVLVVYDDAPYLMWVKSTAGLSAGEKIQPCPVYVAGTRTVQIPGKGTQSVTILSSVTETEVREAVFGKSAVSVPDAGGFRTWTDRSGKFSVEAKFVRIDGSFVILERRDGKTIKVPLDKLSKEDADWAKR